MSLRLNLLASIVALPLAFAAQEAAATPYTFSSSGAFTDCVGCTVGSSGSIIGWGGTDSVNSHNYNGSSLVADPLNGQTGTAPASQDEIGELTWFNASTSSDTTSATVTADYKLTLNFTQPTPGGSGSNTFDLMITNTANNARVCFFIFCSNTGDVNDTASLSGYANSITADGLTLSNFSFAETGDGSFGSGIWSNPEDGTSTLKIYADIAATPAAVPEPVSMGLLGTGLLGLGLVRRIRKQG